ncbi:nuclear transport factor 2 family protein [Cellulomonas sp. HZM]|uniref:nuclear transport factor 2 family protein n=1 Tax=Cellulomonas sp. HZM TaxID=1454010 RepID=UPI000492F0E3|nr:nuclear transport factor 2 family protein [Cellulomonas sp. HZM]
MATTDAMTWVAGYEQAWRSQDTARLDELFTPDARYLRSPYDAGLHGIEAIAAFWDDDTTFAMDAELVIADDRTAVVRVEVRYTGAEPQEYRDLWVLRFADDGRVRHFEEWAYWPGLHWSVQGR